MCFCFYVCSSCQTCPLHILLKLLAFVPGYPTKRSLDDPPTHPLSIAQWSLIFAETRIDTFVEGVWDPSLRRWDKSLSFLHDPKLVISVHVDWGALAKANLGRNKEVPEINLTMAQSLSQTYKQTSLTLPRSLQAGSRLGKVQAELLQQNGPSQHFRSFVTTSSTFHLRKQGALACKPNSIVPVSPFQW